MSMTASIFQRPWRVRCAASMAPPASGSVWMVRPKGCTAPTAMQPKNHTWPTSLKESGGAQTRRAAPSLPNRRQAHATATTAPACLSSSATSSAWSVSSACTSFTAGTSRSS
eukprot:gene41906-51939_t